MQANTLNQLEGFREATQALEANRTPRYYEIDRLERFAETTQYEGLPDWFESGPNAKPLWERAPCVAYPIVHAAITSNTDLVLGEGRFPAITSDPNEDDSGFDETDLTPEQVETLDKAIGEIVKQARLKPTSREVFAQGEACRSAVAIFGVRNGRLFVETTKAKWAEPEFDADGNVTKLTIQYPYLDRYRGPDGKWAVRAMLYKRVIDADTDTTYKPAKADRNGAEPKWQPDTVIKHSLGFCPVVWWARLKCASTIKNFDGRAIHEHCLDEIRAHDFVNSQRVRAALYAGDPQWAEFGVDDDTGPGASGRTPDMVPATQMGGPATGENRVRSYYGAPRSAPARRKGPGEVWRYDNPDAKLELYTLPGDALKAIEDTARDLRIKIAESLCVVFMDPENIKFAASLSGKALATLKARQLDRCDQLRDDFGDGFLEPAINILLRIVHVLSKRGQRIRLPGLGKLLPILERFAGDDGWEPPHLMLRWGEYFKPDAEDDAKLVDMCAAAKSANLATDRMCLEKLRRTFGISNIAQALDELEEEAEKRERKMNEAMHLAAEQANAASERESADGDRAGAGGDAPPDARDGDSASPAAPAPKPGAARRDQGKADRKRS